MTTSQRIYDLLLTDGPLTVLELASRLALRPSSVSKRLWLDEGSSVVVVGTRPSSSGPAARLFTAKPDARPEAKKAGRPLKPLEDLGAGVEAQLRAIEAAAKRRRFAA